MTKVVEDIKSGLKGIKGAGDAIRGTAMEATDELFDQGANHPQSAASQSKNRALATKGMEEAKAADRHIGQRHGPAASTSGAGGVGQTGGVTGITGHQGTAAPTTSQNASVGGVGQAGGVTGVTGDQLGTAAPAVPGRAEYRSNDGLGA